MRSVEFVVLIEVMIQEHDGDPNLSRLGSLPYEQLKLVSGMLRTEVTITIADFEVDFARTTAVVKREALYRTLIRAGLPKELLGELFAKSRRQIEIDRRAHGGKRDIRGRPKNIERDLAYEIAGAWDSLKASEPDYAARLAAIHESFPKTSLASICRLVGRD